MYCYDDLDRTLVAERVAEFRDQVARRLSGELSEEEFKPLRLMNGVYLQLHAYMLRIAIPYGTLSSTQLRTLAHVARRYDRGYGHFTTRQNIQFHWIKLAELPDAMADLAGVGMHGGRTSGNCVRSRTTGQWAGKNLDSSEKFVLGGAYGIRAYPQGEAAGDEGWLATAELRHRLSRYLQWSLFYDAGGIDINRKPFAAGANSRHLSGYGIGLAANWGGLTVKADVAWRGDEAPTSDRDRQPRTWAMAGWRF